MACLIGSVGILSYLVLFHSSVLLYKMVGACLIRFCRDIVIPDASPSFSFIVQDGGCMFDWFCRDIVIPGVSPSFSFIVQDDGWLFDPFCRDIVIIGGFSILQFYCTR